MITDGTEDNLCAAALVHAAAWREYHRAICSEAFVSAHTTERQMDYIRSAIAQGRRFFLMTDDDVPVAVVSVDGNVISDLYVHPDHQRRGYGMRLLIFSITQCEDPPMLWVLNTNEGAQSLYMREGFTATRETKTLSDTLFEIQLIYGKDVCHA